MTSRRERLRAEAFEPERVAIIERRFPYFARLSEDDRRELLGHVRVFLDEKKFEGCGGVEITDEMVLTIAAQACLLLLHRETDYYPELDVILVYPHSYRAKHTASAAGGVVVERDDVRLGESHRRGIVVLSWDAVKRGAEDPDDGHNVVLHEFAHKLDEEDGAADGAPVLDHRSRYAPWARVLGAEHAALSRAVDADQPTDIDRYGATNPAEFFAVVTEEFFETPEKLAKNHPHLYEQLASFYKQDPLARLGISFTPPDPKDAPSAPRKESAKEATEIVLVRDAPDARELTNVSAAFRERVIALGYEPVGFVGTLHATERGGFGFVCEVLRCPDVTTVGALYAIGSYGDGLSFHTVLDNGTIIATETSKDRPPGPRILPFNHPREHFFVVWRAEATPVLYATHLARVKRIATRENAVPLARAPVLTYTATRLRATDLLGIFTANRRKLQTPVTIAIATLIAVVVASRAHPLSRGAVAVACGVGAFVALLLGERIATFLERRRFRSAPTPVGELFARASRVDDAYEPKLRAILRARSIG